MLATEQRANIPFSLLLYRSAEILRKLDHAYGKAWYRKVRFTNGHANHVLGNRNSDWTREKKTIPVTGLGGL
jgi:hypothetical protein